MKKQISAVLAAAMLAVAAAACGSTPTASTTATAGDWQANTNTTPPTDSTNTRVPNLMGSGN